MKATIILISAACLAFNLANAQNLLLNGDFNSSSSGTAPDDWSTWTSGSGYANYEVLSQSVLIDQNDGSVHPDNTGNYDGTYQMTLGAAATDGSGGGVYQMTSATAGLTYDLNVDAGAQGWWLPTGQIRLFFYDASNNQLALTQINTTDSLHNSSNGGLGDQYDIGVAYQNWNLTAVAPAGTTQAKVEFAGYGGGSCWFDNASLSAVPEPGTFALFGIGLALLFGRYYRLRNASRA